MWGLKNNNNNKYLKWIHLGMEAMFKKKKKSC